MTKYPLGDFSITDLISCGQVLERILVDSKEPLRSNLEEMLKEIKKALKNHGKTETTSD